MTGSSTITNQKEETGKLAEAGVRKHERKAKVFYP